MAKKTSQKKNLGPKVVPSPKPVLNQANLEAVKKSLQEKASKVIQMGGQRGTPRDGYGKPEFKPACVEYTLKFADGSVMHAEGNQATVLFNYVSHCEELCSSQSMAYYDGKGMRKYTAEEWEAKQAGQNV